VTGRTVAAGSAPAGLLGFVPVRGGPVHLGGVERQRQLVIDGARVDLTPLEFDLLRYPLDREGSAVERRAILRDAWGTDWTGGSDTIETVISALRRKLGPHAGMIETVRGVGYRAARR
jgi:DNA-binding response OmpR family regulator